MRPYLAILIDSFWEAIGNKVLWALLIGWSLILIGIAPFGYVVENSYRFSSYDIKDAESALTRLADASRGKEAAALQRIVERMSPEFAETLQEVKDPDSTEFKEIKPSKIARELNKVLESTDLYDESAFPMPRSERRRENLQSLLETPAADMAEIDREEFNRELMQLALPKELNRSLGEQVWLGYGTFKIGEPLPISRKRINEYVEPFVLQLVIKLGLGVIAVMVAIVVTSPIIPDTFRSGSLNLLLSKPISRVLLYLSKFFGSTVFVLVNISFVLTALYFIAGFRFQFWNSGLLACIPLLMFVFIIFYSVSALAGLLWKNAIVCVVATMVFWLFCFVLGAVYSGMNNAFEVEKQLSTIVPVGDDVMSVSGQGRLQVWNREFSVWQAASESETRNRSRTFGPFYDEERGRVLAKQFFRDPFGGLNSRARNMSIITVGGSAGKQSDATDGAADEEGEADVVDEEDRIRNAEQARETHRWPSDFGPEIPKDLFRLLEVDGALIAVCRTKLYRMELAEIQIADRAKPDFLGLEVPWLKSKAFVDVTPPGLAIDRNTTASATADGKGIVVYSSGTIDHIEFEEGKSKVVATNSVVGKSDDEDEATASDGTEAASILLNDNYCVLARDGLPLTILDAELNEVGDVPMPDKTRVRYIAWQPETDCVSIVTHTGEFLKLDCATREITSFDTSMGSTDVTCANWISQDQVWLGGKPHSAFLVDVSKGEIVERLAPKASIWEFAYQWIVKPAYYVNPKPAALDDATNYLLSGNKSQAMGIVTNRLEQAQVELDIWQPIITNLCFVFVMLAIGCIYIVRSEF
ncbi:MAG: hypothetical protein Aurels2KO_19380 [Aureliella sp.]